MIDQNLVNSGINYIEDILTALSIKDLTTVSCYAENECRTKIRSFKVVFPLGFFLHAYSLYPENKQPRRLQSLVQKVIKKLEAEKKESSYNYFTRDFAKKTPEFLLPDDLDDTVLIASALNRVTNQFDERIILKIIGLETKPGGPYITWYVPNSADERWKDVDPAVNAHLLYFVSLLSIKLPQTRKYLKECIENNQLQSVYYPSKYFTLLNLAKYFNITNDIEIRELITESLRTEIFDTLPHGDKILYILIKLYCKEKLLEPEEKFITGILKTQNFSIFPICLDFAHDQHLTFTTNTAVSLSFYLEMLLLISQQTPIDKAEKGGESELNNYIRNIEEKIFNDAQTSQLLEENITRFPLIEHTKAIVLPLLILQEFAKIDLSHHKTMIETFILCSYYGWIGYTILDEVIDNNKFSPGLIISNSFLRKHHFYLAQLTQEYPEIEGTALSAFNITDNHYLKQIEALTGKNTVVHKDTTYIQERMAAYLVMLSLLPALVGKNTADLQKDIYDFVKALVVIDQLNDDSHDWEIDLKEKNETLVTYHIKRSAKSSKNYKEVFWSNVIKIVDNICTVEYNKARNILQKYNITTDLLKILEKSYAPIKIAAAESKKVKRLMKYYSDN
jgi:hypothetical protein